MTDATSVPPARVLARASDGLGHLTLNRPEAINALDLGMIRDLGAALRTWRDDPDVRLVLLDGAGERGLCAGGDVRGLYEQVVSGRASDAGAFFREEYALNALIAEYPKPVVVIADGITMGGGIGLAGHAAHRVVTERSKLAMPETRIGFTPDVGGTWLLAHAPGRLGEYLGLTGAAMTASDALYAGFADRFVRSDRLPALIGALRGVARSRAGDELDAALAEALRGHGDEPGPAPLALAREWIDDAFSVETVGEIVDRLQARGEDAASATLEVLAQLSPTGLAVTLAAVRSARGLPGLRAALAQEHDLVMWFATTQPDLPEGIRAQLVDKDRAPRWNPATTAGLDPGIEIAALAFRPETPLWP